MVLCKLLDKYLKTIQRTHNVEFADKRLVFT